MLRLLAHPERYHGRRVQTAGVAVLEEENFALYLSHDAARSNLFGQSAWLSFSPGVLPAGAAALWSQRVVMVEGTFDADERGHMGLFGGSLRDITRAICEPSRPNGCAAPADASAPR